MAVNSSEKPPPKKPGRRRIACAACSANKQKCDGASRHPCRRCELYGLSCEYPGGEVPASAVRVVPAAPASVAVAASSGPSAPAVAGGSGNEDVAAALRDMAARLASIEAGLEADRRAAGRPSSSSFAPPSIPNSLSISTSVPPVASSASAHAAVELPVETNPLQVLVSTMEQMQEEEEGDDMDADDDGSEQESLNHLEQLAWKARHEPRSQRCDAFARGLVTLEDVQIAFGFYTQRLQPWVPVVESRPPLVVRERSPFLFHIILLVTNYYNTSTLQRAKDVYNGLNSIVHELLVRHILAPDASMFNRDFVRGLLLLLYYKPVQPSFAERGVKSASRVVHASKVNALSSLMIHALIRQASSFLGFFKAPSVLAPYLEHPTSPASPAQDQALADFRTWCTIIAADAVGSLQNGRLSWTDPSAALQIVRRFAALGADPTDVRRAAVLELYGVITLPPSAAVTLNPVRYRLEHLASINRQLDAWKTYWQPILSEAQGRGDPLAYTVTHTLAQFVILAVNGAVFTQWEMERKKETEEGKAGRPTLTTEDWQHLQRAANAAGDAIFVVSVEATSTGHPLREVKWAEPVNGQREALTLDPRVTEDFKTALDTMTCVAFIYSLLFLVRMASAGLITCDLETRQSAYEAGCDLTTPQALATGTKLHRLLELGSQFLTGISPNPDHPCVRHALLVELILRVGLTATTPSHGASPAGGKTDKRSPVATTSTQQGGPPVPQRSATYPFPTNQPPPPPPSSAFHQTAFQSTPTLPELLPGNAPRPSVSSFESWLWDTTTPNPAALSGPLRMQDGSFVMPDLSVAPGTNSGGGGGSGATPPGFEPSQLTARPSSRASNPASMSSADRAAALAMAAGAGRGGNAIASLLSEINPFMDDMYSTQPNLAFGAQGLEDFGLSMEGLGGAGLEWMTAPGVGIGGLEGVPGAEGDAFGISEGGPAWPFAGSS